jgi:hypothetical protein
VGDEILDDTSFDDTSKWQKATNCIVSGGVATATDARGTHFWQIKTTTLNGLYVGIVVIDSMTEGKVRPLIGGGVTQIPHITAAGIYNKYRTDNAASTDNGLNGPIGSDASYIASSLSIKRVLDPPSTGIHIVSAYGGSVRAWTSIDSGFDPNTITSAVVIKNIWNQLSNYYRRRRSS